MIRIFIVIAVLFLINICRIQAQPGPIKNLRYEDNFKYLKSDSIEKKGTDKLKFIPLSKSNKSDLSLGGEVREWYEIRRNPNFGDLPPYVIKNPDGSLFHRFMLHGDLRMNDNLRAFAQINHTLEIGNPNAPFPEISEDGLGLHQFFVDINFGTKRNERKSLLRLGRQEYNFGNELIISSREGPNNRQAFDGVTYVTENSNSQIHILAATPVIINTGVFDNSHISEVIWGTYAYLRKQKNTHLDIYYLGFYSERRQYNYVPGDQHRHTTGARLWNHGRRFYYDAETMYQTGKFNNLTINAFDFTGEVRYVFQEIFWKPMIGIGASYISGDLSADDSQLNTYDPLYPKPLYGLGHPPGT